MYGSHCTDLHSGLRILEPVAEIGQELWDRVRAVNEDLMSDYTGFPSYEAFGACI